MPGTRTAPDLTAAATYRALVLSFIDASGDERSVRYQPLDAAVTDAQLEAAVATTQALVNASIYRAQTINVFAGDKLASNALAATYQSVYDNIVVLLKNSTTTQAINGYAPSPLGALMPTGDTVNTTNTDYIAWRDAISAILGASFSPVSTRFTERREKNDSIPA